MHGSRVSIMWFMREIATWEFIYAGNKLWCWRSEKGYAGPFANLPAAQANAATQGFDPLAQHWVKICCGHTTHHQPGRAPFSLPCGEAPNG